MLVLFIASRKHRTCQSAGVVPADLEKIRAAPKCCNEFRRTRLSTRRETSNPTEGDTTIRPKDGVHKQLVIVLAAKKKAIDDRFLAPREIIMKEIARHSALCGAEMPSIEPLTRRLQYERAKHLPPNPRQDDLFFNVHDSYFPSGWYRGAVTVDDARHLLF